MHTRQSPTRNDGLRFAQFVDLLRNSRSVPSDCFTHHFANTQEQFWDELFRKSMVHGVQPLTLAILLRLRNRFPIPQYVLKLAETVCNRSNAYNLFQAGELARVQMLLERAGIPSLTIKGPVLAQMAYNDLSVRVGEDLDILVPLEQFRHAEQRLESDGYHRTGQQADLVGLRARIDFFFNRQVTFCKGSEVFKIDLHAALVPPLYCYPVPFEGFWGRAMVVSMGEYSIRTFSVSDSLQLLCFHGLKDRWHKLRHVIDIHFLVSNNEVHWNEVLETASQIGARRVLFLGLWLSTELFGTHLPAVVLEPMRHDRTVPAAGSRILRNFQQYQGDQMNYADRVKLNLMVQERLTCRLRYALLSLLRRIVPH